MRTQLIAVAGFTLVSCTLSGFWLRAEAPRPVTELAPIADLQHEISAQVETLTKLVATPKVYEEKRESQVRQSFGLLAVLGQTLAEHAQSADLPIQGAALRDAALKFKKNSSLEEAQQALDLVKLAVAGKAQGEFQKDHPWNKLVNMHPMMEEINGRNSAILRVLRRPRGTPDEAAHATTWVVLGLAMKADTHEVKNEADLPTWHKHADAFIAAAQQLSVALRNKDKDEGRRWFDAANQACDACHEVFQ